jgi:hypothetical protein
MNVRRLPPLQELLGNTFRGQLFPPPLGGRSKKLLDGNLSKPLPSRVRTRAHT